jgi:HTH-type transcriptional regulator, sugar sensing transcriptional regulator
MNEEVIEQIQKFLELQLTEREAKIYMTLLSKKSFTAVELQRMVNIPRTKIYDVLQKMVRRGIVIERPVDSLKYYEAVNPDLAFKRVVEKYKREYESDLEKKLKAAGDLVQLLTPVYEENRDVVSPLDFIEILRDSEYIQKRFITKYVDSKHEVLSFTKGPFIANNSLKLQDQMDVQEDFLKRGGKSRAVYELPDLIKYDWLWQSMKEMKGSGEEVRIVDSLPMKMLIFDSESVMFPLRKGVGEHNTIVSVWIEHTELASACKILFETFWDKGKTIDEVQDLVENGKTVEV